MPPEREEESADATSFGGGSILPDWQGHDDAVVPERFFDRFMGEYSVAPLEPAHETRSLDLDPVDARENEVSPGVRRRLRGRQRGMSWPMPVSRTMKSRPSWE